MKYLHTALLLTFLLVFGSLLSFASEQHKTIDLDRPVTVGHQKLTADYYTLKFDDSKTNTEVEFQHNGKTVATAQATVLHKPNPNNAEIEINTANGQDRLDRVYLGKNEELAFGNIAQANTTTATQSSSTSPSMQ